MSATTLAGSLDTAADDLNTHVYGRIARLPDTGFRRATRPGRRGARPAGLRGPDVERHVRAPGRPGATGPQRGRAHRPRARPAAAQPARRPGRRRDLLVLGGDRADRVGLADAQAPPLP